MTVTIDKLATVEGVLAAAVANGGTFTIANPTGFSPIIAQPTGNKLFVNQTQATVAFAFGASVITVTNNSGATWPAGSEWYLELQLPDGEYYVGTVTAANDTAIELVSRAQATGIDQWTIKSNALAAEIDTAQAMNDFVDVLRVGSQLSGVTNFGGTPAYGTFLVRTNDGTDVDLANISSIGLANTD